MRKRFEEKKITHTKRKQREKHKATFLHVINKLIMSNRIFHCYQSIKRTRFSKTTKQELILIVLKNASNENFKQKERKTLKTERKKNGLEVTLVVVIVVFSTDKC